MSIWPIPYVTRCTNCISMKEKELHSLKTTENMDCITSTESCVQNSLTDNPSLKHILCKSSCLKCTKLLWHPISPKWEKDFMCLSRLIEVKVRTCASTYTLAYHIEGSVEAWKICAHKKTRKIANIDYTLRRILDTHLLTMFITSVWKIWPETSEFSCSI